MNKRTISLGGAALLVVTLLSTGIASATPGKVASFSAGVTPGHPSGAIVVRAKVLHPDRTKTFTASAVADLIGVDVPVPLRRAGKSYVAVGKIPVPAGQAAGSVNVVITIVYDGGSTVINKTATITAP